MAKDTTHQTPKHYPPVITVLGHVDHGKTSLLDAIRKTSIAAREHGGITQKIGASSVTIDHDGHKRKLTFIDTPGHEIFTMMRSRGAQVADIGLLIVSSVDGVMPQTKESIAVLQQAAIPIIVVFTKVDVPEHNIEKVKQQVMRENILLEGLGGDTPYIEVSSKTGKNIKELLELILLVQELHLPFDPALITQPLQAVVIESRLDMKAGPKASVIVKKGTIRVRDEIEVGDVTGKVRTLLTDQGIQVQEATVGDAVEILGLTKVPQSGEVVHRKGEKPLSETLTQQQSSDGFQSFQKDARKTYILLIADTIGSLEAIEYPLPEGIEIVSKKTGEVSEADVIMAKSSVKAYEEGPDRFSFNARVRPDVLQAARLEKVLLKNYSIIYELLDELADVVEGKALALEEKIFGKAKIQASFPYEKQIVAGIKILEGRVAKGDKVRIERGDQVVGEGTVASLRQGKNQTSKVEAPNEAGIIISPQLDFTIGDMIICHG